MKNSFYSNVDILGRFGWSTRVGLPIWFFGCRAKEACSLISKVDSRNISEDFRPTHEGGWAQLHIYAVLWPGKKKKTNEKPVATADCSGYLRPRTAARLRADRIQKTRGFIKLFIFWEFRKQNRRVVVRCAHCTRVRFVRNHAHTHTQDVRVRLRRRHTRRRWRKTGAFGAWRNPRANPSDPINIARTRRTTRAAKTLPTT